jgi:hypothetical protein
MKLNTELPVHLHGMVLLKNPHRFRKILYPAAALVIALFLGALFAFRYYGLPEKIRVTVEEELRKRGLAIGIRSLYLDPLGGITARDVIIYQTSRNQVTRVRVEKVRFSLNWISWWRGEPFLEAATVHDASLELPVGPGSEIRVREVYADVELLDKGLRVRSAEGRLHGFYLKAAGHLAFTGLKESDPPTEEEMEARARLWNGIEAVLRDIRSPRPITLNLEFDTNTLDPLAGTIRLEIDGRQLSWKEWAVRSVVLRSGLSGGQVRIDTLRIALERGGLEVTGSALLDPLTADLRWSCDADPTLLEPFLPAEQRGRLPPLQFHQLPEFEGLAEYRHGAEIPLFLKGRFHWKDFSLGPERLEEMTLPFAFDGKRLLVTGLLLRAREGQQARLDFFREADGSFKGRLEANLDPTRLRALAGPGGQPLMKSLEFRQPPVVKAEFSSPDGTLPSLVASGTFEGKDFSYANGLGTWTSLTQVETPFTLKGTALTMPALKVVRVPGEEASASVVYDFGKKWVQVKDGRAKVIPSLIVPIFGGKVETYVKPYRFAKAPEVVCSGVFDLETHKGTDFKIALKSEEGMDYTFLGKEVRLSKIDADLFFKGTTLRIVAREPTSLFGGAVAGTMSLDLSKDGPPHVSEFTFRDLSFGDLLRTYFDKADVTGTLEGKIGLAGNLADMASLTGSGVIDVRNGDLYKIPAFGALSVLLDAIIPDAGYAKADKGHAEFTFKEGKILISKIDMTSVTMALVGSGSYDYVRDDVDLSMRVTVRGPLAIVMFPVSKFFEYRGTGRLSETKWESKVF